MTRAAARGRLRAVLLAGVAALLALETWAAPAPWYYWRSKVDGRRVCAQASPGEGWERDGPPYEGAGCTAPRKVFVIPMR